MIDEATRKARAVEATRRYRQRCPSLVKQKENRYYERKKDREMNAVKEVRHFDSHRHNGAETRDRLHRYCQANGFTYCQEHKGGELLKEYFANHKNKEYGEFNYDKALQFAIDAL